MRFPFIDPEVEVVETACVAARYIRTIEG